jgi:hypothetical protein
MNEKQAVEYKDPISGMIIRVQSVYIPARTLLQGAPYVRSNNVLNAQQRKM